MTRSLTFFGVAAFAGITAGVLYVDWAAEDSRSDGWHPSMTMPGYAPAPSGPADASPPEQAGKMPKLRLDGSLRASQYTESPQADSKTAGRDKDMSGDTGRNGALDLQLPDMPENTAPAKAVTTTRSRAIFDLEPEPQPVPDIESYNLFNPEYGLRGFMKQEWISRNVGLLGGLGLNDERRIETKQGLQDDVAVGMGVILAF